MIRKTVQSDLREKYNFTATVLSGMRHGSIKYVYRKVYNKHLYYKVNFKLCCGIATQENKYSIHLALYQMSFVHNVC